MSEVQREEMTRVVPRTSRVQKQVSLDETRNAPVWPQLTDVLKLSETPKSPILMKRLSDHQRVMESEVDACDEQQQPGCSYQRDEPHDSSGPLSSEDKCKIKRKQWASLRRHLNHTSKESSDVSQKHPETPLQHGRAPSPVQKEKSKKSKKDFWREFISSATLSWSANFFGTAPVEQPVMTAYTQRLRMMHEKEPFDDIQVI